MIFYDATKHPDKPDVNFPADWNMQPVKMLYESDFWPEGDDSLLPRRSVIRDLANACEGFERVCINIERWRLYLPGSWGWYEVATPNGTESNQACVDAQQYVLTEFKKFNSVSLVGWWDIPGSGSLYDMQKKPEWNWYGPPAPAGEVFPYTGYLEMEQWRMSQLCEVLNYGAPHCYWELGKEPEFDMRFWQEMVKNAHAAATSALHAPVILFGLMRKDNFPETVWFENRQFRSMMGWLDTLLTADDGFAIWEGNQRDELNDSLVRHKVDGQWIETMETRTAED